MVGLTHEGNRLCNAEIADSTNNQDAEHALPVADAGIEYVTREPQPENAGFVLEFGLHCR